MDDLKYFYCCLFLHGRIKELHLKIKQYLRNEFVRYLHFFCAEIILILVSVMANLRILIVILGKSQYQLRFMCKILCMLLFVNTNKRRLHKSQWKEKNLLTTHFVSVICDFLLLFLSNKVAHELHSVNLTMTQMSLSRSNESASSHEIATFVFT